MGTHNHRLQLGGNVYLEIVALDPEGAHPGRAQWFGVDDKVKIETDWREGRRLRGWVASVMDMDAVLVKFGAIFGEKVMLPSENPSFAFSIPADGSLPLDGAAPSLIDHRGDPTSMADIPDLGARLQLLTLEHPEPESIAALYKELAIANAPEIMRGPKLRYRALINTPNGVKELT